MADPGRFRFRALGPICALHNSPRDHRALNLVNAMLPLLFSLFRRKTTYVWSPDLDLRDPYVAAALVPVSYS